MSLPTRPSRRVSSWWTIDRQRCRSSGDSHAILPQRVDEHEDRGERRAQLVRDRREELVLDRGQVRAAGDEDASPACSRRAPSRRRPAPGCRRPAKGLRAARGDQDDADGRHEDGRHQRRQHEGERARGAGDRGRRPVSHASCSVPEAGAESTAPPRASPAARGPASPTRGPASTAADGAQVPDDPEPREQPQHVVGHVDLPPAEALPGRARVVVMVVVPPLAGRGERQPEAVARVVAGRVAPAPEEVRQRVDRERAVPDQHRGDEEAPDEGVHAAEQQERGGEQNHRHDLHVAWLRKRSSGKRSRS